MKSSYIVIDSNILINFLFFGGLGEDRKKNGKGIKLVYQNDQKLNRFFFC